MWSLQHNVLLILVHSLLSNSIYGQEYSNPQTIKIARSASNVLLQTLEMSQLDADEGVEGSESSPETTSHLAVHTAVRKLFAYQKAHPDFAEEVAAWFAVGLVLLIAGKIVFIYSEVKAVLICRDQEFRKFLHDNDYMLPSAAGIAELELKEAESMKPRVIISLVGFGLISIGLSAVLYPTCDILDIIGVPNMPCFLLVTLGSLAAALFICFLILSLAWSCTRPWAALVFAIMWASGALVLTYATPFLLVIWLVLVMGGGYWYFRIIPEQYDHDQRPCWFQIERVMVACCFHMWRWDPRPRDVGDLVWDDSEWRDTVAKAIGQARIYLSLCPPPSHPFGFFFDLFAPLAPLPAVSAARSLPRHLLSFRSRRRAPSPPSRLTNLTLFGACRVGPLVGARALAPSDS